MKLFSIIAFTLIFTFSHLSFANTEEVSGSAEVLNFEDFYLKSCTNEMDSFDLEMTSNPDNLREAQRMAILKYTQAMFQLINPKLWKSEPLSKCEKAFVVTLDSALTDLPNYIGTVYRGTTTKYISLEEGSNYPTEMLGYTSTTVDLEVADSFMTDRREMIAVNTGKDISAYSGAHMGGVNEKEILLPRGVLLFVNKLENVEETVLVWDDEAYSLVEKRKVIQTINATQVSTDL